MPDKINIAISPSSYFPLVGGVEELTKNLAKQFLEKGFKPIIITVRQPQNSPKYELFEGIAVYRFRFKNPARNLISLINFLWFFPGEMLRLLWLLKSHKITVINIQCVSANGWYILLAKKILRLRLVTSSQGERLMDATGVYRSWWMNFVMKKILQNSDHVTGCAAYVVNDLKKHYNLKKIKSSVLYNGVNLNEFNCHKKIKERYIFSTGRMAFVKGFDLLIEAFARIAKQFPAVNLKLAGDGPEKEKLIKLVEKYQLTDRVEFLGFINKQQTVKYMCSALFFVMCSRYEPFGIVNTEAMAAGKAVIASAVGGIPEYIKPGKNGLLFEKENVQDLVLKITQLLKNKRQCEQLGLAGRVLVEKFYNWDYLAAKYLKLFLEL